MTSLFGKFALYAILILVPASLFAEEPITFYCDGKFEQNACRCPRMIAQPSQLNPAEILANLNWSDYQYAWVPRKVINKGERFSFEDLREALVPSSTLPAHAKITNGATISMTGDSLPFTAKRQLNLNSIILESDFPSEDKNIARIYIGPTPSIAYRSNRLPRQYFLRDLVWLKHH